MALTTTERTNLIKLAVGMFNAAPGATYLADLSVAYEANGHSLANLAKDLSNNAAFKSIFPVFQTAADFASAFLTTLGLQNNSIAVDFVTAQFNAGISKGQIIYSALTALDATTDSAFQNAKSIINNKAVVAEYYSVTKAMAETNVAMLQQVLVSVDTTQASVTKAEDLIDHPGGNTSTSTTTDSSSGTDSQSSSSSSSNDSSNTTPHYDPVTHTYVMSDIPHTIEIVGIHPF